MRETGEQRAVRIPLDYYKRPDRLALAKTALSAAALIAGVWWVSGLGWDVRGWGRSGERSRRLATPGTLARAHALWETQCEACHVPYRSVGGGGWTVALPGRSDRGRERCEQCHAGTPHHADEKPEEAVACAACHRDHRGLDASLTRVEDGQCVRCHRALYDHKPGAAQTAFGRVVGFDAGSHPEFRLFRDGPPKDPGTIAFSHALHTAPGQTLEPGGKPMRTLADLAEPDGTRYRRAGQSDRDAVQLDCASCHQFGGDGPGRSHEAAPAPIAYDTHCRACHPLNYDVDFPALTVRHGLQPDALRQELTGAYASLAFSGRPELQKTTFLDRPIPGLKESPERRAARKTIGEKAAKAEQVLFGSQKCGECHAVKGGAGANARIEPAGIPRRWFAHSVFDHAPHRAVRCVECHEGASAGGSKASRASRDVLLPTIRKCQECHAPRGGSGKDSTGGARTDCAECHRYHGVDSAARDGSAELTLKQFLHGGPR